MPNEEMKYFSVVTDTGSKKLVQAAHDGIKVNVTHFAVGDGGGDYVTPSKEATGLVHECYRSEIFAYEISENDPCQLIIRCLIPSEVGTFTMREWGLFDEDGDLIAIANTADSPLFPAVTGEIFNLQLRAFIQFSNLENEGLNIVVHNTTEELILQEAREAIDRRLGQFTDRIDALEAFADGFDSAVDAKLEPVSQWMDDLEKQMNDFEDRLEERMSKVEDRVEVVQSMAEDLIRRVAALEDTVDGVEEFFEEEV